MREKNLWLKPGKRLQRGMNPTLPRLGYEEPCIHERLSMACSIGSTHHHLTIVHSRGDIQLGHGAACDVSPTRREPPRSPLVAIQDSHTKHSVYQAERQCIVAGTPTAHPTRVRQRRSSSQTGRNSPELDSLRDLRYRIPDVALRSDAGPKAWSTTGCVAHRPNLPWL